jgi:hypothetical protein
MAVLLWKSPPSLRHTLSVEWTRCISSSICDQEVYSYDSDIPEHVRTLVYSLDGGTLMKTIDPLLSKSVRDALDTKKTVVILHLGDEDCVFPPEAYPSDTTVVRSYYHPKYIDRCVIVPLGYSNFFTQQSIQYEERPLMWSFSGCVIGRPHRVHMLKIFSTWSKQNEVHITRDFNSSDGLERRDYRDIMNRSVFIPCSAGYTSAECFRTWEALEAGCIPITCRTLGSLPNYYDRWAEACRLPPIPWPQLETWEDIFSLDVTAPWKAQCETWWEHAKKYTFGIVVKKEER